jgi:hypothetical protein
MRWWTGLGVFLALSGHAAQAAQPAVWWARLLRAAECEKDKPSESARRSESESAIEHKLRMPIGLNIHEVPLKQVIDELRQMTGINIVLDTAALEEGNVNLECPLTLKVDNVSVQSALLLLVKKMRLAWVIKDEVVQITTAVRCHGPCRTVTYPVADLIVPIGSGENELIPFICRKDPEAAKQHTPGCTCEEQLIKLITSTVEPTSWSEMGGKGTIQYFPLGMSIVVHQPADVQEQVQDLLAALRRAQAEEDREYKLTVMIVERKAGDEERMQLPCITFVRGQLVNVTAAETIAIRHEEANSCAVTTASCKSSTAECVQVGTCLKACVTKADRNHLHLYLGLELSGVVKQDDKGLEVAGRNYRLVREIAPDKWLKVVLEKDDLGKPKKWLECRVEELPIDVEETTSLNNLPPIPR